MEKIPDSIFIEEKPEIMRAWSDSGWSEMEGKGVNYAVRHDLEL